MFKMLSAWLRMCTNTNGLHVTSHQFEQVRIEIVKRNKTLQSQRSEESKKKQSDLLKSYKWWNNGIRNTRALECPGEGWVEGRYWKHSLRKDMPKEPKIDKRIGHTPWNKGLSGVYKTKPATEERKQKISAALKGRTGTNLGKKFTQEHKDRISKALIGKPSHKQNEETRKLIGAASKGRTFWNDGISTKFQKECPGEGWVKGKIK